MKIIGVDSVQKASVELHEEEDEVYFMTTEGQCLSFGYYPNISGVIPAKDRDMSLQPTIKSSSIGANSTK